MKDESMPLLPLEPFIHPDDLLAERINGDGDWMPATAFESPRWWVLHTRPRAEKALARRLLTKGIPFFLPLYHRRWRSRSRLLESYGPLFPGYVFLQSSETERMEVLKTKLVANSLVVRDQRQLLDDLQRVYHLMEAGVPLSPEDRLVPGSRVEITSGPLAGMTAKFLRRGRSVKIFVEVQFLQRGVSVELESWSVRPLAG
jgi:transcriptional antiterminator RfaH